LLIVASGVFERPKKVLKQSYCTKLKWILDKAAVENEPGLTNAQMMLTNNDLRPGVEYPFEFGHIGEWTCRLVDL
jgi:hypothetical protein